MKRLVVLVLLFCYVALLSAVTLTEYLPEKTPKTAIVICPGGSYFWLDYETEGDSVARSLVANGIAATG